MAGGRQPVAGIVGVAFAPVKQGNQFRKLNGTRKKQEAPA
jgi:hypothetical protein